MQLQQVPSLFLLSSFAAFFTGDKQAAVKQDKNNASFTQTYIEHTQMYSYNNILNTSDSIHHEHWLT